MKRLRTFIALELDRSVRDRLVSLQEGLARTGADVKWVEPENLHLTMLFLGEVDERALIDVCRAVEEVSRGQAAFGVSIETVGSFPNLRRPRVLWVGVGEGAAEVTALHDALEGPLLRLGCYRREERSYTPHITLGRVRQDGAVGDLAMALARKAEWKAGEVRIGEVLVMSSELSPQGPVYAVLSRARLGARRI